jgi:putative transposase
MLKTASIKLIATQEQSASFLKTMAVVNAACDFISAWCFSNKTYNWIKIHKALYRDIRIKFNLPSQFAIRAIRKVADTYKLDKKIRHEFKRTGAIDYDARLLNWKSLNSISINTVDGRLKAVPVLFGKYAAITRDNIKNSAKLVYRKKQFYLQAAIETPEEPPQQHKQFLGVDLGIINLATTDDGASYSGKQVEAVRIRLTKLKARLQRAATKSAKQHLKKISKTERNFKRNTNHIISKQIVSAASRQNVSIAIEDLHKIQQTVRRSQRDKHDKWAFYELIQFILYKAKIAGVSVIKVDPHYTSRTCSNCGHCEKANRKNQDFCCKKCGFFLNADHNAAINIKNRAISAIKLTEQLMLLLSWALAPQGAYLAVSDNVNEPIVAIKKQSPRKRMSNKPRRFISG